MVSAHLPFVLKRSHIFCLSLLLALFPGGEIEALALEGKAMGKKGLKNIQLITDISAITPGEPFTVALIIDPLPGHHTYWRGPGIVGVATNFNWTLPAGFTAGEVSWPPPQKVIMAGITAYGYRDRQMLLTVITPPDRIEGDEVTLVARIAWMACATSCNPGVDDFTLTLPVNRSVKTAIKDATLSDAFTAVSRTVPPAAPANWKVAVRAVAPDRIELDLSIPGLSATAAKEVSFFCYDMQVDSDAFQKVEVLDAVEIVKVRLHLVRPEVAPRAPSHFAGVLHCPDGWPGIDSPFAEISVPWPTVTISNE
jgi:DsbC/DsbD-like thiol-disulfide interchange protein